MAMTYYINRLIAKYPDVIVGTNYNLICQDFVLDSYEQLFVLDNGKKGIIYGFDEIQATFNSRAWKDFPPDLLAAICQNRKAHRVIYGTSQNITLIDVALRKQCMRFAKCYTWFSFLTLVVFLSLSMILMVNYQNLILEVFVFLYKMMFFVINIILLI